MEAAYAEALDYTPREERSSSEKKNKGTEMRIL